MAKKKTEAQVEAQVSAPVTEESAPAPKLSKYKVGLPFLPFMEVEAADELEAKAAYNKLLGVLKTIHKHEVTKL